jgi:hypothetical protein
MTSADTLLINVQLKSKIQDTATATTAAAAAAAAAAAIFALI